VRKINIMRVGLIMICFWAMAFYWVSVIFPVGMNPPTMLLDLIVSILVIDRVILWLPELEELVFNNNGQ